MAVPFLPMQHLLREKQFERQTINKSTKATLTGTRVLACICKPNEPQFMQKWLINLSQLVIDEWR